MSSLFLFLLSSLVICHCCWWSRSGSCSPLLLLRFSPFILLFLFSFSFLPLPHSPPAASHHGRRPAKETEAYPTCKRKSHGSCVVFCRLPLFPLNLIDTALGPSNHCACSPQLSSDHYEIYPCNKAFSGFIILNSDYLCILETWSHLFLVYAKI